MAVAAIDLESIPFVHHGRVVILTSKWHSDLVESMEKYCTNTLQKKGITQVTTVKLPGTLEMPLAAKWHIEYSKQPIDAIVCLSVVEKGSTAHFDMIIHSTTQTLMDLSVESEVPIINEIIAVSDIEDAIARASDNELNKGIEAAAAALEMIELRRQLI